MSESYTNFKENNKVNKSFSLIIVILCMLFSCNELPDKPVRDNIFDTNASFDDEPPIAHISVSQDTGFINETYFEFSAKSSIEEEHPDAVLYYKWDLNNDGIWDTELSSNENIKVIYSDSDHSISNIKLYEPGELTIKLFVLGALNKSTTISYTIYVYDHPKIVLDWKVDLFSSRFYFDASGSADWTGDENLEMRWDFNNDNIWDTDWNNNKLINYLIDDSYGNTWGTKLEVKDRFNFTSEILTEQYRPDISGLVAYFPFSGNCLDSSGNNLNGTNYGATPAEDRFGNPERALYFNGSNDYIDLGKNEKLKPSDYISISTWIKLEEAG